MQQDDKKNGNNVPQDKLSMLARLKGRDLPQTTAPDDVSDAFPVSKKIEKEMLDQLKPGLATSQGIFLGEWRPHGCLGKVFNVFAAPTDLTDDSGFNGVFTYDETVERVAALKDWYGADGTNYACDQELYTALQEGRYTGGWIIPTSDLLNGHWDGGSGRRSYKRDNLFAHRDDESFKDTFTTKMDYMDYTEPGYPAWYWSSTEYRNSSAAVWLVKFSTGEGDWYLKDFGEVACRPVRLVEIPQPEKKGIKFG